MVAEALQINITADNKAAITAFTQVQKSAFNLKEELLKYQSLAFTEKDTAKIQAYNQRIQELQIQLKQVGNIGKQGFDDLGNAIDKNGFKIGGAISDARRLQFVLRTFGGIGLFQIFSAAYGAIAQAAQAMGVFNNQLTPAQNNLKNFNEVMTNADKKAGEETTNLRLLYKAATDVTLSMHDRLKAAAEIKKEYPDYLENISKEAIVTGKAESAIKKLTAAIIENARAKAIAAKIGELEAQKLDAEIQKTKILNANANEKANAKTYNTGGEADATITAADQILNSNNRAKKGLAEQDKIIKQAVDQQKFLEGFMSSKSIVGALVPESPEKVAKVDEYAKLLDNLAHIQDEYSKRIIDNTEYNKKSIAAIDEATKHLALNSDEYKRAILLRDQFYQQNKDRSNPTTRWAQSTDKTFADGQPGTPNHLDPKGNAAVNDAETESLLRKKAGQEELNKAMAESAKLALIGANAFSALFDSMAKGDNIGEALAKVFQDLVKQIALSVVKAFAFAVILNVISGGAYSIGEIFTGALGGNFSGKGYANGGISTGPKSGHMELLHGTEAIMTPSQMQGLFNAGKNAGASTGMGGGRQVVVLETRVAGNDIWLSQQRTQYNRNLTT